MKGRGFVASGLLSLLYVVTNALFAAESSDGVDIIRSGDHLRAPDSALLAPVAHLLSDGPRLFPRLTNGVPHFFSL